jgi:hypothetical protein
MAVEPSAAGLALGLEVAHSSLKLVEFDLLTNSFVLAASRKHCG